MPAIPGQFAAPDAQTHSCGPVFLASLQFENNIILGVCPIPEYSLENFDVDSFDALIVMSVRQSEDSSVVPANATRYLLILNVSWLECREEILGQTAMGRLKLVSVALLCLKIPLTDFF